MTYHFIERLMAKTTTTGEGSSISIRPAITPDVLPETFYLPEQRFIHSTSAAYSKVPISSSTEAAGAAAAAPTEQRIPSRRDVLDIHAKDVETGESDTSHFKKITTDTTKMEKGFVVVPASSEAKDVELTESKKSTERAKEPAMTSVHKDVKIRGFEPQEDSAEKESEDLRSPPLGTVVLPRESGEQRHEDLSAATSKIYDFLQTRKKIEALRSEPEVTINIGRVDVRAAVIPEKPAPKTQQFPPLSLKEYLKQRSEGRL
jgi:hypothetical protein